MGHSETSAIQGGPQGLARWHAHAQVSPSHGVADFVATPRASDALRAVAAAALAFHDEDASTTRSHPDVGMILVSHLALYLEATGGLTQTRLRESCARSGFMSPGRASAVLKRLQAIGYIAPAQRRGDGKIARYSATDAMLRNFQARFRIQLEAAALVEPAMQRLLDRLSEREVFLALMVRFVERTFSAFAQFSKSLIPFFELIEQNLALLFVMVLLQQTDRGEAFPCAGTAGISVSLLARRFSISRTQARRLLARMEAAGFIARRSDGQIQVKPSLVRAYTRYFSQILVGVMSVSYATIVDLGL